jgi:hypothetical protein
MELRIFGAGNGYNFNAHQPFNTPAAVLDDNHQDAL